MKNNFKIIPYEKCHLDDAVDIFVENFEKLLLNHPLLPVKYTKKEVIKEKLAWITSTFQALVLLKDDELIGFISGIVVPNMKSSRMGVYTPEWAYGIKDDYLNLYNELHAKMLTIWANLGCSVFGTTVLEHHKSFMELINYNGYGMFVIDCIRGLDPIKEINEEITVRRATNDDAQELVPLLNEHNHYMKTSPTFLYFEEQDVLSEIEGWFKEENRYVFVALKENQIIGCMNALKDGTDASTIIQDHNILKVTTTHVLESAQGQGVAKTLLNYVNNFAIENHFNSIAVDFESANIKARNFWLRYFKAVNFSFIKYIDDRVINH